MQISAEQGQFMALLIELIGARQTIEVGTFTGYSALAVAAALPDDGRVVACDINAEYAAVGAPFWREAAVEHKIDLRIGPAIDSLRGLREEGGEGQFDFAFIRRRQDQLSRLLRTLPGFDETRWTHRRRQRALGRLGRRRERRLGRNDGHSRFESASSSRRPSLGNSGADRRWPLSGSQTLSRFRRCPEKPTAAGCPSRIESAGWTISPSRRPASGEAVRKEQTH